jgi:hypothetical protein
LKTKVYASKVDTREKLCHQIEQFSNEIKNIPGIFQHLRVPFSRRAKLCVCEHGGNLEHLLEESKNIRAINSSFVYFLFTQNPLNSGSIQGVMIEV